MMAAKSQGVYTESVVCIDGCGSKKVSLRMKKTCGSTFFFCFFFFGVVCSALILIQKSTHSYTPVKSCVHSFQLYGPHISTESQFIHLLLDSPFFIYYGPSKLSHLWIVGMLLTRMSTARSLTT